MHQPDDPGPPDDPTRDYYDRKMRHREEMLRPLAWLFAAGLVMVMIALFFFQRAEAQAPVPFSEDCDGAPADECQIYNQATVWVRTGIERKISFCEHDDDVLAMALFYGLEGYTFPPAQVQVPFMTAELPEGSTFEPWTPQRAGAVYFRIRACRTDIAQDGQPIADQDNPGEFFTPELRAGTTDEWVLCSTWNTSLDAQVSSGTCSSPSQFARGFFVQVELAPATGGGIE